MPKSIKYSEPVGYFPKEIREKVFGEKKPTPKKTTKKSTAKKNK